MQDESFDVVVIGGGNAALAMKSGSRIVFASASRSAAIRSAGTFGMASTGRAIF